MQVAGRSSRWKWRGKSVWEKGGKWQRGGEKREKGALRAAQAHSSSRGSSEEAVQARQRWQLS